MIPAEVLEALVAAGATPDMIVAAVRADQAIDARKAADKRAKNAKRMRDVRERSRTNAHNDEHARTDVHASAPPKVPPITPLNTPGPSHPSDAQADVVGEDPKARLFRIGKTLLASFGVAEKRTGSLIGQWLKARNDPAGLLAAIQFARDQNVAEPVAYISTLVHNSKGKPNGRAKIDLAELCFDLADEWRRREAAGDVGRTPDVPGSH